MPRFSAEVDGRALAEVSGLGAETALSALGLRAASSEAWNPGVAPRALAGASGVAGPAAEGTMGWTCDKETSARVGYRMSTAPTPRYPASRST